MRVSFLINVLNDLKLLGSVIDICLMNKHDVKIFFDNSLVVKNKGLQNPSEYNLPKFKYGIPQLVSFNGKRILAESIQKNSDIAVFSQPVPRDFLTKEYEIINQIKKLKNSDVYTVGVLTYYYDNCLLPFEAYSLFDKVCAISEFCLNTHKKILLETCNLNRTDRLKFEDKIDKVFSTISITGFPMYDEFENNFQLQNNLTKKNKIVFYSFKNYNEPFFKTVVNNRNILYSLLYSAVFYKFKYFKNIILDPNAKEIFEKINSLSLKNNLDILIKSRPKNIKSFDHIFKKYNWKLIDGLNEEFYPESTANKILKNSLLTICARSFSVVDSVYAGIPSIYLDFPINYSYFGKQFSDKKFKLYTKYIRSTNEYSIFNWPGCIWNIKWSELPENINSLENFRIKTKEREKYLKKFFGKSNISSSQRCYNAITG